MKNTPVVPLDPVCASVAESLAMLPRLQTGVDRRNVKLLRAPDQPSLEWYMFVPKVFNTALGIVQMQRIDKETKCNYTIWGQSAVFAFATGDMLYSHQEAYHDFRPEHRCFQVRSATPSESFGGTPGFVIFDIFEKREDGAFFKAGSKTVTQVEFVRILIAGFQG
jgi:hypothetical protein